MNETPCSHERLVYDITDNAWACGCGFTMPYTGRRPPAGYYKGEDGVLRKVKPL